MAGVCSLSGCWSTVDRSRTSRGSWARTVGAILRRHQGPRLAASVTAAAGGPTACAGFLTRAAAFFAGHGIIVRAVITDNAESSHPSREFRAAIDAINAQHPRIRPLCPSQNGKVERFNRTIQVEWAYRRVFNTNDERRVELGRRPEQSLRGS
jgi:transposase InsO family protein